MKALRYLAVLALVFLGVANAESKGLFPKGGAGAGGARAYAVSTEFKSVGDRVMAHVELRDLDSNRPVAGVYGFCTVGVPAVFPGPRPGSELRLTVREAGDRSLRYVVELSGVVPEFRYESVISVPLGQ
jgi:hypothetical protein